MNAACEPRDGVRISITMVRIRASVQQILTSAGFLCVAPLMLIILLYAGPQYQTRP